MTKLKDVFDDPDYVGSSEYRALVELLLDANDISNIGGEFDPEVKLPIKTVKHMIGMLDEVISHAKTIRSALSISTVKL